MSQHEESEQKRQKADTVAFLSSMAKDIHQIMTNDQWIARMTYIQTALASNLIVREDYDREMERIGKALGYSFSEQLPEDLTT